MDGLHIAKKEGSEGSEVSRRRAGGAGGPQRVCGGGTGKAVVAGVTELGVVEVREGVGVLYLEGIPLTLAVGPGGTE